MQFFYSIIMEFRVLLILYKSIKKVLRTSQLVYFEIFISKLDIPMHEDPEFLFTF